MGIKGHMLYDFHLDGMSGRGKLETVSRLVVASGSGNKEWGVTSNEYSFFSG